MFVISSPVDVECAVVDGHVGVESTSDATSSREESSPFIPFAPFIAPHFQTLRRFYVLVYLVCFFQKRFSSLLVKTISKSFYFSKTISKSFFKKLIPKSFLRKTISKSFYFSNTISKSFLARMISKSFFRKTISKSFLRRTISKSAVAAAVS